MCVDARLLNLSQLLGLCSHIFLLVFSLRNVFHQKVEITSGLPDRQRLKTVENN